MGALRAREGRATGWDPAIFAEGLSKRYGRVIALEDVGFEVQAGSVLGLLGPNGAGKTTTVRILATLVPPDGGSARVAGLDLADQAQAIRRRIGLAGQYAAVDRYLTGRENLRMIARLYGLPRREARRRADELLESLDLVGAAERQARSYSGGMRRRLDIAAAMVACPPVLFLDEPTAGLDPRGRIGVWQLLDHLVDGGTSVLLTTQAMDEAERLADRIVVLDRGRVIARGTADELKARVGGDRLEVRARPGDDPRRLAAALEGLGPEHPVVDADAGRVVITTEDGPAILPEVAARLATSGLGVADLALRRPTLEDVFLALTAHPGPVAVEGDGPLGGSPRTVS